MKKTLTIFALILTLCLLFTGCKKCEQHVYDDCADTECNECGEKRDSMHTWLDADCDTPKTCETCGKTEGKANGHTWVNADCDTPKTCSICSATEGEANGHTPKTDDGDCTTALTCEYCDYVFAEARTEHTPMADDADCSTALTCEYCDFIFVDAIEHSFAEYFNATHTAHWHRCLNEGCEAKGSYAEHTPAEDDGDCTTPILCVHCSWGIVEANDSHISEDDDGDCSTPITCIYCDYVFTEGINHDFEDVFSATHTAHWYACQNEGCEAKDSYAEHTPDEDDGDCTTAIRCSVCKWTLVEGNAEHSHDGDDGDCTTELKCNVCDVIIIEATPGHTPYDDGDCTTALTCEDCDYVFAEARAEHTPMADDGDCTTAIKCEFCDVIITEAEDTHSDTDSNGLCDVCELKLDYIYYEESNTYKVYTAEGLYVWLDNHYKRYNLSLAKDIVLPSEMKFDLDGDGINDSNWDPAYLSATVDGNGHSISGLIMKPAACDFIGFFADIMESGVIRNLNILDADISSVGINIGILAGYSYGLIENCSVSGKINVDGNNVGGFTGTNYGKIIACSNHADITVTSGGVGGIIGQHAGGEVIACYNTGSIISERGDGVGGISGNHYGGLIQASYSNATVSSPYNCGGISGYCAGTLVSNYWSTTGEAPLYGYGSSNNTNAEPVDGETITWQSAMAAMNAAIDAYNLDDANTNKCNYKYALNTDAESLAITPLILVEA